MLRTASSLPLTGLLTLGSDPARFQTKPPACYRASWQLPGPDSHRQATTSLRTRRTPWTTSRCHLPFCWAHENTSVRSSVLPPSWRRPCRTDSCRLFRADPLLPRPVARLLATPRTCPRQVLAVSAPDEGAPQGMGRRQPASLSGPCTEKETVGFICQHACPPRHL